MINETNENVGATGLANNDLTDERLGEILVTMLNLKPDHRIRSVAEQLKTISSRMTPELRDELLGTMIDAVMTGAEIHDVEMTKRARL